MVQNYIFLFSGIIKIPAEESSDDKPDKSKKEEFEEIQLNDQVYEQLQDLSVGGVALKLREIVDELKGEELVYFFLKKGRENFLNFQQRKSLDSVAQYKNFIAKLPNVVVKRKSTGIFMRLAGVVQQRESDDFYRGLLRCEQGFSIFKDGEIKEILERIFVIFWDQMSPYLFKILTVFIR